MTKREVETLLDPDGAAHAAAKHLAKWIENALFFRGVAHVALSGGETPWMMLRSLCVLSPTLNRVCFYQVDERAAPDNDPARNATHINEILGRCGATLYLITVNNPNLDVACSEYEALLPPYFDVVHLGLGEDGHTASLIPNDPLLQIHSRAVAATTSFYQGHRRVSLTYSGLARAHQILWLVTGKEKRSALKKLLHDDPLIPASGVKVSHQLVVTDTAALN